MSEVRVETLRKGDVFLWEGKKYTVVDFGNTNHTDVEREGGEADTFLYGTIVKVIEWQRAAVKQISYPKIAEISATIEIPCEEDEIELTRADIETLRCLGPTFPSLRRDCETFIGDEPFGAYFMVRDAYPSETLKESPTLLKLVEDLEPGTDAVLIWIQWNTDLHGP